MFLKIFLNIVLLLNVVFFTNVKASDVCSDSFTFRDVYQKPAFMAALDWMQVLENERDKADIAGNFEVFKRTTDEISATIAGKYGLAQRSATPEEQLIIIHSITRTRHRFMGQRNMIYDRYLGYDRKATAALLQTDSRFTDHMVAVFAVDVMVRKALNEDEFHEQWDQGVETGKAAAEFIPAVISYAETYEKKEVFQVLNQPLQEFLQHRQATIGLANEVFNIFAPKVSLAKVYNAIMNSGGTYKGWTVHNPNSLFPSAICTTGCESEETEFMGIKISYELSSIFSLSERAVLPSGEICRKIDIKPGEMVLEIIRDQEWLDQASEKQERKPKTFYLSRPVKPLLASILKQGYRKIPFTTVLETYKKWRGSFGKDAKPSAIKAGAERGISYALNNYACWSAYGMKGIKQDIALAVTMCQDAADLGNYGAIYNLDNLLYKYACLLVEGSEEIEEDTAKASEFCRKAAELGNEKAREDLAFFLYKYALILFSGKLSLEKDTRQKAVEILKEAADLGSIEAKKNLPFLLNEYVNNLFHGTEGVERNVPKALEICREAADLGEEHAIQNLPIILLQCSSMYLLGLDGIKKDLSQAVGLCQEAADAGHSVAQEMLLIMKRVAGD